MMAMYFDKEGNELPDTKAWGKLFEDKTYQVVQQDTLTVEGREVFVSTVWLGLDHGFGMGGPPVIFETMIFAEGGTDGEYQWRYSTLEQAQEGHLNALSLAPALMTQDLIEVRSKAAGRKEEE